MIDSYSKKHSAFKVVLISTYEQGRQPFGLASPATWLCREGIQVLTADLSIQDLPKTAISSANLLAFYIPMYTATRLSTPLIRQAKNINPSVHICFYGLYAPMNEAYLRNLGADTILGGEFETGLVSLCNRLRHSDLQPEKQSEPIISLQRQTFIAPNRNNLPSLSNYASLQTGNGKLQIVGYTEASRGCKHHCRHCPVVPVYQGKFRIIQHKVVMEDIRRQVAAGAEHITFGDPDFFNGIGHALPLIRNLHREHPNLTYDVTIKIEHILKHVDHLPTLRDTGCIIVTSAVESTDNHTLYLLDKGHTKEDFILVSQIFREIGLTLNPTFIPFTPWTTLESYSNLIDLVHELNLDGHSSPIQLAIRLLIPKGSYLLRLPEIRSLVSSFDPKHLGYPWKHSDLLIDQLQEKITTIVAQGQKKNKPRQEIFWEIRSYVHNLQDRPLSNPNPDGSHTNIPYLNEPWYC